MGIIQTSFPNHSWVNLHLDLSTVANILGFLAHALALKIDPLANFIPVQVQHLFEMIDSGLVRRGTTRAEDAQGTPTQSHASPSILAYEDDSNVVLD